MELPAFPRQQCGTENGKVEMEGTAGHPAPCSTCDHQLMIASVPCIRRDRGRRSELLKVSRGQERGCSHQQNQGRTCLAALHHNDAFSLLQMLAANWPLTSVGPRIQVQTCLF